MTELTSNGNDIGMVGNQYAGNRMTKRMGIDMRQIMPFAEFAQPCGNAVRMHDLSVIPRKQKAGILPAVAVQLTQMFLFSAILAQQRNRFGRNGDKACFTGFRCFLINTACLGIAQIDLYIKIALIKVNILPLQSHNFAAPRTGDDQQMRDRPPLQRFTLECLQDTKDFIRLKVVDLFALSTRQCRARRCIVGYDHFLFSL